MNPFSLITNIIAILIAISVHECAHAVAASRLGDPTAHNAGRLTLNPISHIDPLGALMFIFVGFGWAKPVPVNPMYFSHPKRDMAITAVAGPVSNLLLAILAFGILAIMTKFNPPSLMAFDAESSAGNPAMTIMIQILRDSLGINLALMAFNLLPVPPLDGSNILRMFIPLRLEEQYDSFMRYGPFVLLGLVVLESVTNIPILSLWVFTITDAVLNAFMWVAGMVGLQD